MHVQRNTWQATWYTEMNVSKVFTMDKHMTTQHRTRGTERGTEAAGRLKITPLQHLDHTYRHATETTRATEKNDRKFSTMSKHKAAKETIRGTENSSAPPGNTCTDTQQTARDRQVERAASSPRTSTFLAPKMHTLTVLWNVNYYCYVAFTSLC